MSQEWICQCEDCAWEPPETHTLETRLEKLRTAVQTAIEISADDCIREGMKKVLARDDHAAYLMLLKERT